MAFLWTRVKISFYVHLMAFLCRAASCVTHAFSGGTCRIGESNTQPMQAHRTRFRNTLSCHTIIHWNLPARGTLSALLIRHGADRNLAGAGRDNQC